MKLTGFSLDKSKNKTKARRKIWQNNKTDFSSFVQIYPMRDPLSFWNKMPFSFLFFFFFFFYFFQTSQWTSLSQWVHRMLLRAAVWIWPAVVLLTLQQKPTPGTGEQLLPHPCFRWAQDRCCPSPLWRRPTLDSTAARPETHWEKTIQPRCC